MTSHEPHHHLPLTARSHTALRRLELRVVRRLDGLLHGEHLGLRLGPGSEPAEARPYQPGEDDVRRMDWSVTARTTHPHVRDLVADRELESWTLLDLSASMDFGTATSEKRDVAIGALAAVTVLTQHVGDRFGAHLLHHGHIRRWPAHSGKNALYTLLSAITATPRSAPHHGATLTDALDDLARTRPRRGLRVIISDFLTPTTATPADTGHPWEHPLRHLATRHQTLAIEIVDPRELDLPPIGLTTMTDPETGHTREVHLSASLRRRYAHAARAQRDSVRAALRRSGVPHLLLRTDRDWIVDIARFVIEQRRTAHRLARHTPASPR
ncbi:DUF58 domain-containing protein [Salinactinospora qingdaonensis]|uniref:DUF58 domain-containing protein n=1 Tax=Salinactinospora qingdaonensis TaxID=702744 RepID=A0ABP7GI97_9ACTN